jgi:hypothetical protein
LHLILNDVPDHRDDTIIAKLLDWLKSDITSGSGQCLNVTRSFVQDAILASTSGLDLDTKEFEIVKFVLDLITLTLTLPSADDQDYRKSIAAFLGAYLGKHVESSSISDVNATVLVGLFELVGRLYEIDPNEAFLNDLLNGHLITDRSIDTFLHFEACKSIYVRQSFKQLYVAWLIQKQRLVSPTMLNLDVLCDLARHYSQKGGDSWSKMVEHLTETSQGFTAQIQPVCLLECERLLATDAQIEAFTHASLYYSLFAASGSPNDESSAAAASAETCLTKLMNKLCNHFASRITPLNRAASNLLFKFQFYFYSFLVQSTAAHHFSSLDLHAVRCKLVESFLVRSSIFIVPPVNRPYFCLRTSNRIPVLAIG